MKITICQINSKIGDLAYNIAKILRCYEIAKNKGSDLTIFPELALTGYPLKDLVNNRSFSQDVSCFIEKIIDYTQKSKCGILLGSPLYKLNKVFNAALLIQEGKLIAEIHKYHLPSYDIFDEKRNFFPGTSTVNVIPYQNERLGILICEDIWHEDIIEKYVENEASLLIAINASPYDIEKHKLRSNRISNIAKKYKIPMAYVNIVGAQDEFVFDGGSFIVNSYGQTISEPYYWQECQMHFTVEKNRIHSKENQKPDKYTETENIYQALMLALKDYMHKNEFQNAVLGLSGGIDSALTATIVADAIGAENLRLVMMPSEFSQEQSLIDAKILVENIKSKSNIISITSVYKEFLQNLESFFSEKPQDVTEENLQVRIRAVILMAISNKFGEILITTSNKSESAVGYTTLYGDMSGGFALIQDVYKTQIYELAHWRNKNIPKGSKFPVVPVIPQGIMAKEPSAELKHGQKDTDLLPPYAVLDKILYNLIEKKLSKEQIAINLNISNQLVQKVNEMLINSEFKRNQAPIGPKISIKSLSTGRRYPITYRKVF